MNLLDPHSLLAGLGALGVFLVLFAENGMLVGFFLPGDSLLFTAGLLCATPASAAAHLALARFIPLVRTVVNPLAGTVGIPTRS
jgi:membrane-associated protein